MSITDRLRELEQAATPGPWHRTVYTVEVGGHVEVTRANHAAIARLGLGEHRLADAALIVALRNAAPELLRVVEAARLFRAEQESGDVNLDLAEALWQDLCAALDALEEKE